MNAQESVSRWNVVFGHTAGPRQFDFWRVRRLGPAQQLRRRFARVPVSGNCAAEPSAACSTVQFFFHDVSNLSQSQRGRFWMTALMMSGPGA